MGVAGLDTFGLFSASPTPISPPLAEKSYGQRLVIQASPTVLWKFHLFFIFPIQISKEKTVGWGEAMGCPRARASPHYPPKRPRVIQ